MSGRIPLRVAVVGATGSLGSELVTVLEERRFPVEELTLCATDRSTGTDVEFRGRVHPVHTDPVGLAGQDLVFLCAPAETSLHYAREALRARVPCLDLSGALADQPDVPLLVADLGIPSEELGRPLISTPAGPALGWALVLAPIAQAAGLSRILGTALLSASGAGRLGVECLSAESIALFNQKELPEPGPWGRPIAFDCVPAVGEVGEGGHTQAERALGSVLGRLLDVAPRMAVTGVRVPTFAGDAATLVIETERPLSAEEACAVLDKAAGVEVWRHEAEGPTAREGVGRDVVLVGRVRPEPGDTPALLLWLAADSVRLAALNAVRLAEARLELE